MLLIELWFSIVLAVIISLAALTENEKSSQLQSQLQFHCSHSPKSRENLDSAL